MVVYAVVVNAMAMRRFYIVVVVGGEGLKMW